MRSQTFAVCAPPAIANRRRRPYSAALHRARLQPEIRIPMKKTPIQWLAGALGMLLAAGVACAQSAPQPAPQPATGQQEPKRKPPAKVERPPAAQPAPHKPAALESECAFTGKRVVNSLARDDVDAAQKFVRFYEMFSCPAEHLRDAFRCAVEGGAPAPGRPLSDRVDECWDKAQAASKKR